MDSSRNELDTRNFEDMHFTLAFEELKLKVEAILFASDRPLEVTEIRDFIGNVSLTDVRLAIKDLGHDFEGRSVEIIEIGRKYQLRTRQAFADTVTKLFSGKPRSLSKSSLETLAIVAYRQPVTRAEVNALRQVDSSQVMISLREKELIYPSGTRKEAGHPVEYKTTQKFLDLFALGDLTELPKLRSLQMGSDESNQVKQALERLDSGEIEETLSSSDLSMIDPAPAEFEVAPESEASAEPLSEATLEPEPAPEAAPIRAAARPATLFEAEEDLDPETNFELEPSAAELAKPSQKQTQPKRASRKLGSVEDLLKPIQ